MSQEITFGYSPCPNDTFSFHALVHGLTPAKGYKVNTHLADVEQLNRLALKGSLEMTKLSFHALGHVLDRYALLKAGSALGRGCGPLVVVKKGVKNIDLSQAKIAVPGRLTTAHLLLSLYLGKEPKVFPMEFNLIMDSVAKGEFDAGLIIHESRFTYERHGLKSLLDLGQWWEKTTDLPIPLGCIAIRRDMGKKAAGLLEEALSQSVSYAFKNPDLSRNYVLENAQEMETDVVDRHIGLYVNKYSVDLGQKGIEAVKTVLEKGHECGLLPEMKTSLFMTPKA